MTSHLAIGREDADRTIGADAVQGEIKQFRKLQHLADADVAYRMASTEAEVRQLRNMFGQRRVLLRHLPLDYAVRLILGRYKIKTLGQLLAQKDETLRAIPGLGPKRMKHIRDTVQAFLAK